MSVRFDAKLRKRAKPVEVKTSGGTLTSAPAMERKGVRFGPYEMQAERLRAHLARLEKQLMRCKSDDQAIKLKLLADRDIFRLQQLQEKFATDPWPLDRRRRSGIKETLPRGFVARGFNT